MKCLIKLMVLEVLLYILLKFELTISVDHLSNSLTSNWLLIILGLEMRLRVKLNFFLTELTVVFANLTLDEMLMNIIKVFALFVPFSLLFGGGTFIAERQF